MDIIKKPYEISLWKDVLVFVVRDLDGVITEYERSIPSDATGQVIAQYYKEHKICIIGSDTMDTPIRATQPKLVTKVNGENVLTFNMYSHYYDTTQEESYQNPFIGLLVNERKIKLRYGPLGAPDTKWYDLIIKNIQENSESKTYSYTAKDLFANELSKSGFNLEFDQELENNMGNIDTLAERVLDGSDWKLLSSDVKLKQTIEEPLYHIRLNKNIKVKDMEGKVEPITIEKGEWIYVFYNNIVNEESFTQLLYVKQEGNENPYTFDDDHIITNSPNWYMIETVMIEGIETDVEAEVSYNPEGIPDYVEFDNYGLPFMSISSDYRGKRLVRKVKTTYDATIDKYVSVYDKGKIYGYTETEYLSPATTRSYVTNPNSYDSYVGWEVGCSSDNIFPQLNLVSVPDVRDVHPQDVLDDKIDFKSCLKLDVSNKEQTLYNSGVIDMRHHINGFTIGDQYVFRIKYGEAGALNENGTGTRAMSLKGTNISLTLSVCKYELKDGQYHLDENPYFQYKFASTANDSEPEYLCSPAIDCTASLSYAEMVKMSNSLGLFIQADRAGTVYIEDVQFFPYVETSTGETLLPTDYSQSEIKTKYYYYVPNPNYKQIEEVEFVYEGYTPSSSYKEDYNETSYEKIRSITASESNRFNLIQELCEIFECWPKFEIEHDAQTGRIELDSDYRQKKWVSFHEYIGSPNYAGFKYGINLKSIQRTIESEGIVSKLIVKNNSNEFATDGFCSIARATESPNGENFILDFSYYIQQGMMGLAELTNDLYAAENNTQGYIGYYKALKRINTRRDQYIKEQSGLLADIAEYSASLQTYNLSLAEASKQQRDKLNYLESLTGYSFDTLVNNQTSDGTNDQIVEWWDNDQVVSTITSIGRLGSIIKNHQELANIAGTNLTDAQNRYDELNLILTSKEEAEGKERLLVEKERLNSIFYKKYSRFLQEGSWISEDYIDDNLYFLDAQSTLNTSAKPKITYNISVLELSQVEGYENYTFALGDKTTIEDTEFFGWTWHPVTGAKTPYREEIVVTELTIMLDSPEQNQIKVQNYKTQFEDLFQRMAATTQSVEYSTGTYQKVADIVEADGTINITTLQNSIANNALTLQNSKDQSVVWDETGITTTSLNNPAEIVRIVSGGVFLSVDGGVTWNTGVTGKGINASYITSGQLNVEQISILNGSFPSFRWDNTGLSAYAFIQEKPGEKPTSFNFSKFIRLDQYGLYGINGHSNFDSSVADDEGKVGESKIWKYSNFALTWNGFQIKSNQVEGGYISITSNNDLQVFSAPNKERVKLGYLWNDAERDSPTYGLRLRDDNGAIVMEHSSDGKVWIRDELQVGEGSSIVKIGYLKDSKKDTADKLDFIYRDKTGQEIPEEILTQTRQVINASNKFIVHEDGSMVAEDGQFTGIIYATGGKIGNMDIASFVDQGYEVAIEIQENSGTVFDTDGEVKTLIAVLYKDGKPVNDSIVGYQWYKDGELIPDATSNKLVVNENSVTTTSSEYSCQITKE